MRDWVAFAVGFALVVSGTPGARADDPKPRLPDLRLVHLRDGLRDAAPASDLSRVGETDVGKLARVVGLDLLRADNPLLAARLADGRLFYVFYKTTANAFGDRAWLLQRIRKTERTWRTANDPSPEVKDSYQVEAFKLHGGRLKRADQHHGSFALQDAFRREIVKDYEIGFGEIPGVAEGAAWPFPVESLYRLTQPYQPKPAQHAAVKFLAARRWTLSVRFDRGGLWSVTSPELGFDAPAKWPALDAAIAPPDPSSKEVVLEPGVGVAGLRVGKSTPSELVAALGKPLEDVEAGREHRLLSFERSLTCNVDPEGRLKTVITRPGFAGRTKQGVAHGRTRAQVMEAMGAPKGQPADATEWAFPGLLVVFDAFDRVVRLVVTRPP